MTNNIRYNAYIIDGPTQDSLNRSLRGVNSPYRAKQHTISVEGARYTTHYDESVKEYMLVYKRVIGETFVEPSGSYVYKIPSPDYYGLNYVYSNYYERFERGNSTQRKPDNWNIAHVQSVCDQVLEDIVFSNPHDTPPHRSDIADVLTPCVELLKEGDVAAAHWWLLRNKSKTSQHVNVNTIYTKADAVFKKLYEFYPWMDVTRTGNEG